MHITLLGTGADHCIPAFRCTCKTCMEARKKRGYHIRANSSAAIKSSTGEILLIDMPPQILTLISQNRINDKKIHTILVTHRHEDHTGGLRYFFHASEKKQFKVDKAEVCISQTTMESISKRMLTRKKAVLLSNRENIYDITIVEDRKTFKRGEWIITPIETGHLSAKKSGSPKDESLGYVIQDKEGKTCVYLLDAASPLPEKTWVFLNSLHINCLIGDCTYEKTSRKSGHMDITSLGNLTKALNPDRSVASHISHMNLEYDELKKKLNQYYVELGYDGMELEI